MNICILPVENGRSTPTHIGGKAANLNQLMLAGFTVPAGFVITTTAYDAFVTANGLTTEIQSRLGNATGEDDDILTQFLRAELPKQLAEEIVLAYQNLGGGLVAVRSSATAEDWAEASFAGQQESYLNVAGETAVLDAVKKCWASVWSSRAIAYRARQEINSAQVRMAVLIQQMVQPDCAGVFFTQNPLVSNDDTMVVEAVAGLGDSLVSGHALPDRYVVNRQSGVVETAQIQGETAVLSPQHIMQLTQTGQKVASLFGSAQDIEWAIADGRLYLLQSRAITTLPTPTVLPPAEIDVPGDDNWQPEEEIQRQPFDLWTRANFGEVLPHPVSPLTMSSLQMIGDEAEVQLPTGEKIQMARRIYGRIFANEGGLRQFAAEIGLPTSFIDATWGSRRPDLPPRAGFQPWRLLYRLPQLMWQGAKAQRPKPPKENLLPKDEAELYKQIDAWAEDFRQSDLSALDTDELWHTICTVWEPRRVQMYQRHTKVSTVAFIMFAPLDWLAKQWGKDAQLAQSLIAGISGVYAAEMGPALQQIAQALQKANLAIVVLNNSPESAWEKLQTMPDAAPVKEALAQFLTEHGHRCPAEPEISLPRWVEAPEQVLALVAGYLHKVPNEESEPTSSPSVAAQQEIAQRLGLIRLAIFRWILHQAQAHMRRRDNSRHFMAKLELPRRQLFVALGSRLVQQGVLNAAEDIFFLTHAEIRAVCEGEATASMKNTVRQQTAARQEAYEFWCSYPIPEALDADCRPLPPPKQSGGNDLSGVPASGGVATGRVRIIRHPEQAGQLKPGDILVTLATDPGWTPVFPLVAGLVMVYGGQLSHGAIVAREYGVPAVVNVPEAMSRLQEGMVVTVDGSNGRIFW
ncbi:PEP/pyruvate-binding domain-containing protein [Candidatus Leptofilum sp.]|uniref:PEP/pyruvate-binding domain-containing protein n=1 Tax=Candidatus Leptofilum sp. TaxID=3241576 RepID=UPI003B5B6470